MSSSTFADPRFLLDVAQRSQVEVFTNIAAWAWLMWDWASMLDDEINFVWLSRWSFSKCIYILTRYFGIFLLSVEAVSETGIWSHEFCLFYFYTVGVGTTVMVYLVDLGLQVRVWALYNGSKKVLLANGVVFFVEVAILSTLLAIDLSRSMNIIEVPSFLSGCWTTNRPRMLAATWFVALAYELYLFSFVAYKAIIRIREEGQLMGVFKLMFRDALLWFFFIAALFAWNAFSFLTAKNGYIFLGLPFVHAASSIGGSRLVIDIRKAWEKDDQSTIVYVARQPPPPPPFSRFRTQSTASSDFPKARRLDGDWHASDVSRADLVAMGALRDIASPKSSIFNTGRVQTTQVIGRNAAQASYFEMRPPVVPFHSVVPGHGR